MLNAMREQARCIQRERMTSECGARVEDWRVQEIRALHQRRRYGAGDGAARVVIRRRVRMVCHAAAAASRFVQDAIRDGERARCERDAIRHAARRRYRHSPAARFHRRRYYPV